jgi:hypothetical protein
MLYLECSILITTHRIGMSRHSLVLVLETKSGSYLYSDYQSAK